MTQMQVQQKESLDIFCCNWWCSRIWTFPARKLVKMMMMMMMMMMIGMMKIKGPNDSKPEKILAAAAARSL